MKGTYYFLGIDPGIVDTAVIRLVVENLSAEAMTIRRSEFVYPGLNVDRLIRGQGTWLDRADGVWVEGYKSRSNLQHDKAMQQFNGALKKKAPNIVELNNMGIKKVITRPMMEVLGMWSFKTKTNHQDLRSAARILLYGMAKNEEFNHVLYMMLARATGQETGVLNVVS